MRKKTVHELAQALVAVLEELIADSAKTKQPVKHKRKRTVGGGRGPDKSPRKKGYKLYADEAMAIYNARGDIHAIAAKYNVHPVTVAEIKNGRTWSKLTGATRH